MTCNVKSSRWQKFVPIIGRYIRDFFFKSVYNYSNKLISKKLLKTRQQCVLLNERNSQNLVNWFSEPYLSNFRGLLYVMTHIIQFGYRKKLNPGGLKFLITAHC